MGEEVYQMQGSVTDMNTRIRDLDDKQKILKERVLLVGEGLVKDREKNHQTLKEMQTLLLKLSTEQARMQEVLKGVTEQLSKLARREEFLTLQHQVNLIRGEE